MGRLGSKCIPCHAEYCCLYILSAIYCSFRDISQKHNQKERSKCIKCSPCHAEYFAVTFYHPPSTFFGILNIFPIWSYVKTTGMLADGSHLGWLRINGPNSERGLPKDHSN